MTDNDSDINIDIDRTKPVIKILVFSLHQLCFTMIVRTNLKTDYFGH